MRTATAPDRHADDDLRTSERVLRLVAYGLAGSMTATAVVLALAGEPRRMLPPLLIAGLQPVALALHRRGRTTVAASVPVLAIVLATGPLVVTSRGISDPANGVLLMAILIAGILLTPRAAFATAAVTIAISVAAYALERDGTVQPLGASLELTLALRLAFTVIVATLIAAYFTAQERARRKVEETRDFYEALLAHSPSLVSVADAATLQRSFVNRTFVETLGFTLDEFNALSHDERYGLIHPDDRDAERTRNNSGAGHTLTELRLRTVDGWRWFANHADVIDTNADGSPRTLLFTSTDITDRRETDEMVDAMIDRNPVAQVIFDAETDVVEYANPAYVAMTGRSVDEMNRITTSGGRGDDPSTPARELAAVRQAIDAAISSGRPATVRRRLQRPDGDSIWLDCRYCPFPDPLHPEGHRMILAAADITDQVAAETLQRALLDTAPVLVTIADVASGRRLYVSPEFTRVTGLTLQDFAAMSADARSGMIHPDDIDAVTAAGAAFLASDGTEGLEARYRYQTVDGWRWFTTRASVLSRSPAGEIEQVMISGIDITDLVAAQELSDAILTASPAMYLLYDANTMTVEHANPAFTDLTGYTAASLTALLSDRGELLTHPAELATITAAVDDALDRDAPVSVLARWVTVEGDERHVDLTLVPFRDETAEDSRRVLATAVDITDQLEAESFRSTLLESSPALTVVVDASQGRTLYTSPSFEAATGHTADSLNSMPPEELFGLTPDGERAVVDAAIQTTIATGQVVAAERSYRSANGDVRWYDSRFLHIPSGTGDQVMITAIDTTDRREALEALEAERVQLDAANKDLESFVYIASHDLQEPLRTLTGFTDLLREEVGDDLNPEAATAVRYINEGASRMRQLVTGLQEYSRIGVGRSVTDVDVSDLVADVIADLGDQIRRSGATVTVADLPVVRGDRPELRIVFQNLIGNAVKFAASDRRAVVSVRSEPIATGGWRFEVADNGIGIAPEHRERIFEIFRRVHARDRYDGTGIGLAHCKRAVENHGGLIGVESELGSCSTFWFTLAEDGQR